MGLYFTCSKYIGRHKLYLYVQKIKIKRKGPRLKLLTTLIPKLVHNNHLADGYGQRHNDHGYNHHDLVNDRHISIIKVAD